MSDAATEIGCPHNAWGAVFQCPTCGTPRTVVPAPQLSAMRTALEQLVEAIEEPLPEDLAAKLHGQNRAWADWYPSASIVNSPDGPDTGSVIIARIFTAAELARSVLKGQS